MTVIKKKAWPELFKKVLDGEKDFDLRLADFDVKEGDTLILEEYYPKSKKYSGRKIEKKVSFVMKTKDLSFWSKDEMEKYGFIVMSLKHEN